MEDISKRSNFAAEKEHLRLRRGSKVDDLRFNALRAVQCGYAAFKCDVVAVTSLADSCTTLRVKALLQSMTFGSKVLSPLRYESGKAERNALRAVQS